jgi:hypothetical protein
VVLGIGYTLLITAVGQSRFLRRPTEASSGTLKARSSGRR